MRTIRTVAQMRAWLGNARAEQRTVALVPRWARSTPATTR